jgi:hypothetical protein
MGMTSPKFRVGQVVKVHGKTGHYLGNGTVKRISVTFDSFYTYRVSGRAGEIDEDRIRPIIQVLKDPRPIGPVSLEDILKLEKES